jgi:hypothetical protein
MLGNEVSCVRLNDAPCVIEHSVSVTVHFGSTRVQTRNRVYCVE